MIRNRIGANCPSEPVASDLLVQILAADPEYSCALGLVAVRLREDLRNVRRLQLREAWRLLPLALGFDRSAKSIRQILLFNRLSGCHYHRSFDDISEFTHVSRIV